MRMRRHADPSMRCMRAVVPSPAARRSSRSRRSIWSALGARVKYVQLETGMATLPRGRATTAPSVIHDTSPGHTDSTSVIHDTSLKPLMKPVSVIQGDNTVGIIHDSTSGYPRQHGHHA